MMHFLFIGSSVGLDFNPFLLVHYTTTLIKQWRICYVATSPGHRYIYPTEIWISFLCVLSYVLFIYFIALLNGRSQVYGHAQFFYKQMPSSVQIYFKEQLNIE